MLSPPHASASPQLRLFCGDVRIISLYADPMLKGFKYRYFSPYAGPCVLTFRRERFTIAWNENAHQ